MCDIFVVLLTVILAVGVKESSLVNNVFTVVNLSVVIYVIVCGCFKLDFHNWTIPENEASTHTHSIFLHTYKQKINDIEKY